MAAHEDGASHKAGIRPQKELDQIQQQNYELFKSRWPKHTKGWD